MPLTPSTPLELAEPSRAAALRRRVLLVVFVTVFLDMIGFGVVVPILPLAIQPMGGSPKTVGALLTCFSAAQLLATPLLGRLSDRYGRRSVILVSLTGNAVSMIVFALAIRLSLLPLLFASRILAGATSGNLSACQAAIADVTDRSQRAQGMGRVGAGIGLGLVLGPVLGGVVSSLAPEAPPLASALMALFALGLAIFLMPETRRAGAPAGPQRRGAVAAFFVMLSERRLAPILAISFVTFVSLATMQVALPLMGWARLGWGEHEIGYLFGLLGLCTLVVQGALIGPLTRLTGELNLILLGAVLIAAGMVLLSSALHPVVLAAGITLFGVGVGIINPSIASLASRFAPEDQQGAAFGVVQSAGGLGRVVGPTCAGMLFAELGSGAPFLGGAAAAALCLLAGVYLKVIVADPTTRA